MDMEFDSQRLADECWHRGYSKAGLADALKVREATVISWLDADPAKRRVPDGVNVLKIQVLLKLEAKDLLKAKEVVAQTA